MNERSAASLRRALLQWFDAHRRDLPWRNVGDPYAIWVSEVMLQQTQVATVIPYWERFLARFPTVESLAAAPLPEVLALWSGLGYYSRARNLHRAAQEIVSRHRGKLPSRAAELMRLPGFGRYTAGAVASIAFGEEAPLVDGNVARVLSRWFEVEGAPSDSSREARLWNIGERPGDWNQALMELGALVCRAESPTCLLCPVRAHCGAQKSGRVGELPPKRNRPARKMLHLAVAVFWRQGAVLLGRRAETGLFGGLWELPCAEMNGAGAAEALREALGRSVRVGEPIGTVRRTLTHRDLTLELFHASGKPKASAYGELRWTKPAELEQLGLSTAMRSALKLALAPPGERHGGRGLAHRPSSASTSEASTSSSS